MKKLKNWKFYIFPTLNKAKKMEKKRRKGKNRSMEIVYTDIEEFERIHKLFTPLRIKILFLLRYYNELSISDIAEILSRDYKNVYSDVKSLEKAGVIKIEKKGKKAIVVPKVSTLEIKFFFAKDKEKIPYCFDLYEKVLLESLKDDEEDNFNSYFGL